MEKTFQTAWKQEKKDQSVSHTVVLGTRLAIFILTKEDRIPRNRNYRLLLPCSVLSLITYPTVGFRPGIYGYLSPTDLVPLRI